MFALLCMGVCGVRRFEVEDESRGVCCTCLRLMPYVVLMKKK